MQLAVLTTTISRKAGGLFESVRHLHREIAQTVSTRVLSLQDEYTEQDLSVWKDLQIDIFSHLGPRSLSYSPALNQALDEANPDIVHVHGLWQGPSIASNQYYRRTKHPHLISPRGMLDPWALQNSLWEKKLIAKLFEHRHLETAACLHALCESEARSMCEFGLKNSICVIPNGVSLPKSEKKESLVEDGKKRMLFLGRLHHKKGLLNALRAWESVIKTEKRTEWQFIIAGWDQNGHESELKRLCDEMDLSYSDCPVDEFNSGVLNLKVNSPTSVIFTGAVYGSDKDILLSNADAFILPSYSEGLPMSILEAWSYRVPVLMTDHCNLPEGFASDAAYRIGTDMQSIAEGIISLIRASPSDLQDMGDNGFRLVESQFSWEKMAGQMMQVYGWVLGGGAQPSCVIG